MFATVIYSYNYTSFWLLLLGPTWFAYHFWQKANNERPAIAVLKGNAICFSASLIFGLAGLDRSGNAFLGEVYYLLTHLPETSDAVVFRLCTMLTCLMPSYFAFRFLTTQRRNLLLFTLIPIATAIFFGYWFTVTEWNRYPGFFISLISISTIHAALFLYRGLGLPPIPSWLKSNPKTLD